MYISRIFDISSEEEFRQKAIEVFLYQYEHTTVYRNFCDVLQIDPSSIDSVEKIPFLPIQFFKSHKVITNNHEPQIIFESSGTTGMNLSQHPVVDLEIYERSFIKCFKLFYGDPRDFTILALLPSYLERENSSLVYMVHQLIEDSECKDSGFYLNELERLKKKILRLEKAQRKTLLIGVSYALLDLIGLHNFDLKHTIIMETGGMKGKRKEMIKEELHLHLKKGFGTNRIHSEYGMTELLSQAYSKKDGVFKCPPWMRVLTRDTEDALSYIKGKTGGINIVDLANVHSCSFIATQDLGKVYSDHSFEVMGRFDASDIRGCNLMVS